jgi:anion-transporting  ArsA/GET3 family ATPase
VTAAPFTAVIDTAQVIVCCGAGGVGKTTMSAAVATAAAQRGRRVVVVTVDPARRLADALGLVDGLGADPEAIDLADRIEGDGELWAMMLDADVELERVIRTHATTEEQARRALANRFTRTIGDSLGGTQEYMATEVVHRLVNDDRFDLVVVDTPPSAQALDVLDAPDVLVRFLEHPVFGLLMGSGGRRMRLLSAATQPIVRAIGRVIGSDVLADVVEFLREFSGMEASFAARAREVRAIWRDDSTAFVLVTAPRVDTVDETLWFDERLAEHGVSTAGIIVNRMTPSPPASVPSGFDDDLVEWSEWMTQLATAEADAVGPLAERADALGAPLMLVRRLGADVHDATGLSVLAGYLVTTS